MSRVVAIANQKGGVGKTTTTLALGAALGELRHKVLLVDVDPQGSLSLSCGLNLDELQQTLYSALSATLRGEDRPVLGDVIVHAAGVDLVPCNIEASQLDVDLVREPLGALALREALEPVRGGYDYILLDCPPNLGLLTLAALTAADSVLVPLQVDYLSLKGLDLLLQTVGKVRKRLNKYLDIVGVLLTMVDHRTVHTKDVIASAERYCNRADIPLLKTTIRASTKAREAPVASQSVLTYAPDSAIAGDYRALARELFG